MAFIIQVSANNGRISPSCPFPALLIPFLDIAFINEGPAGCINEKSIIAPRKLHSLLLQPHHQLIDLTF